MDMRVDTRTPLSRQRVLVAALRLIDEQGLEALSMRKLGAALGVEAMALYTHVPNKSALLTGVLELLVAEVEVPTDEGLSWVERLRRAARSFRRVAHKHPAFIRLLTTQQEYTEVLLGPTEFGLGVLRHAGLGPAEAAFAYQTLMGYLLGALVQEEAGVVGVTCGDLGAVALSCGAGDLASPDAVGLPQDHFPFLLDTLRGLAGRDEDAAFEFGLELILGALQRLVPSPNGSASAEASDVQVR
jgi:AcrR family transcriptional regulator